MTITAYKAEYDYLIVIDNSLYEMSENATAPNGVNMYIGQKTDYDLSEYEKIPFNTLPEKVKKATAARIKEITDHALGFDWGRGQTNIDHSTGIRFGVIHAGKVGQSWYEDAEADYGKPCCPKCGNEAKDYDEITDEQGESFEVAKHECSDFYCEDCKYIFGSESAFSEEARGFYYDQNGYKAFQSGDDPDIFVEMSPYYTLCAFCSPCAPGAGYLTDQRENGIKAYCFGHDWFESGKAPYTIYDVKTGKKVNPKKG